jgi:hypothetical protein
MPETPNFADTSLWEIIPDVTVFDEHEERDAKGEVIRRFDRAKLDIIVARTNDRDSKGMYCPLAIGHTKDGVPESEQPELVGYAREFFTVYDDSLKRFVIRCKYYVRKEKAEDAKKYPRTSVELWQKPEDMFFDPISMIRRTPQLNIPQWTYAMNGQKIRYAMGEPTRYEYDPMDKDDGKKCAKFKKRFAAYSKSLPSKKKLRKFAKKLAKYAGLPSPDDTSTPAPVAPDSDPGQAKFVKEGDSTMTAAEEKRIRDDQAAIEKAQYAKRLEELEKKDKDRDAQAIRYTRENELKQLLLEGYRLDVADELQLVEGMTAEQFTKHKERIKKQYMRNPPDGDLIRLHRGSVEGEQAPNATTPAQQQAAVKLATDSMGTKNPLSYDQALAEVKKQKTA